MKRLAIIALGCASILVLLWGLHKPLLSSAPPAPFFLPHEVTVKLPLETGEELPTLPSSLPPSLTGVEIPGPLEVTADGKLKITFTLRQLFEFFLSALGEEDQATLEARLRQHIFAVLPRGAAAEAWQQYQAYARLEVEKAELMERIADETDADKLEAIADLREHESEGEVFEAFYKDENTLDRFTAARLRVLADEEVSEEERERLIEDLEEGLPEAMKLQRRKLMEHLKTEEAVEGVAVGDQEAEAEFLAAQGAAHGGEAAERLLDLAKERKAWERRLEGFWEKAKGMEVREREELARVMFAEGERQRVRVWMNSH